jgi:hypothetical protein
MCPGMVVSNLGATSARSRPARFGHQAPPPAPPATSNPELTARMLAPEQVGPVVVRGIRANRLHLFTHLNAQPQVEQRFAAILADFAAEARERES